MPRDPKTLRLWQAARFLPLTVRFLGTRYRPLFLAYARLGEAAGKAPPVADAMAFLEFMARQDRLALLRAERRALGADARALRRRFRLEREEGLVSAVEKSRLMRWLSF